MRLPCLLRMTGAERVVDSRRDGGWTWRHGVAQSALHAVLLLAPLAAASIDALGRPQVLVMLVLICTWGAGESLLTSRNRGTVRPVPHDGRLARVLASATGCLLLGSFWAAGVEFAGKRAPPATPWLLAGAGLAAAGIGLRWAAIFKLGAYFISENHVCQAQPLVREGPYALVRHPSESGLLAIALGAALLLGSSSAAAIAVLGILPVTLCRLRLEEQGLVRGFGDRYRQYAGSVKRLIPLLY